MPHHTQNHFKTVAREILSSGNSRSRRIAALQSVLAETENEYVQNNFDASRVACGPGCAACCTVNVSILEPEALAITEYVLLHFASEAIELLVQRLQTLHRETRWLDDEERLFVRKKCAFLDQRNYCSIHPVRPLLCRSLSSTSPEQCKEAIALIALGEPPGIISNLEQRHLYDEAFLGLANALKEQRLDDASYRLTGKVLDFLQNKKSHS